jgi:predicted DNA-binding helix-hairpin-helix protein
MLDLITRLGVLADAARYDAPCAARVGGWRGARPSGGPERTSSRVLPLVDAGRSADPAAGAICHAVTADGRTVALLKILLTNHCVHDCAYCPLRRAADLERARLTVREVVRITLDYHRRGLIEGLFLSAAVDRSADATMEQLVAVARSLRQEHHFLGYVHLKVIPEASPELIAEAGRWADRLSVNVELPTQSDLDRVAPGRRLATMQRAMDRIRDGIAESHEARRATLAARQRAGGGGAPRCRASRPRGRSRRWSSARRQPATPSCCT